MEIKNEKNSLTDIFLQSKREDDELNYQTTSDYISSDGKKIKSSKKKMLLVKNTKIIDIKKEEGIKKEDKRIIINKRSILLIKGRR